MRTPDPEDLFELDSDRPDLTGAVLLHALDGFVDAGSAVAVARTHLLGDGDLSASAPVIARFDLDQLFDYRARRPVMQFSGDHWTGYAAPELTVRLLHDQDGVPYLLLTGPEPDVQWERFAAAVRIMTERLGVRLSVGLTAFPMSVPHTRPTPVIVHGSRPELYEGSRPWLGAVAVPASVGNMLEYRLGESGQDAMGVAAPVPTYLAAGEYPEAALALLREVLARTGLRLDLAGLEDVAATNRTAIDAEVAKSDEISTMVTTLEQQYDAFATTSLLPGEEGLPSADELGAELERYLAEQQRNEGNP